MRGRYFMWMAATAAMYFIGVATGILVSKDRMEKKYKRIADEEIESVKAAFAQKPVPGDDSSTGGNPENIILKAGYLGYGVPYPISPEEFGEKEGYETTTLMYYADGVLVDENDEIQDAEDRRWLGFNPDEYFRERPDDAVYIRNDRMRTDFEVLRDTRRYSDSFPDT